MVEGYTARVKLLLRENGCTRVRHGKGDHEVWVCPAAAKPVVVDGKIMSRHSTNQVLKDAGIKFKF